MPLETGIVDLNSCVIWRFVTQDATVDMEPFALTSDNALSPCPCEKNHVTPRHSKGLVWDMSLSLSVLYPRKTTFFPPSSGMFP